MGTHGHLPLLASDDAHAILRDAWLQLTGRSGWFVGHYLVLPAQVRLFATSAPHAWPLSVWMERWQTVTKLRIGSCSRWPGELWERDSSPRWLGSMDDYSAKLAQLREVPAREGLIAEGHPWRYRGMIWELEGQGCDDLRRVLGRSWRG